MQGYELKFFVGAGSTPNMTPDAIAREVRNILGREFGGGTVMVGEGFWTDPDGHVAVEPSVIGETHVETIRDMPAIFQQGQAVAARLARLFRQQAVRVTCRPIEYLADVEPVQVAAPLAKAA